MPSPPACRGAPRSAPRRLRRADRGALPRRPPGLEVLDRNWRCAVGEIDIVALDGDCLVVCEVKTRRRPLRQPAGGGHTAQAARLRRLAAAWLASRRPGRRRCRRIRVDVVGVLRPVRAVPRSSTSSGVVPMTLGRTRSVASRGRPAHSSTSRPTSAAGLPAFSSAACPTPPVPRLRDRVKAAAANSGRPSRSGGSPSTCRPRPSRRSAPASTSRSRGGALAAGAFRGRRVRGRRAHRRAGARRAVRAGSGRAPAGARRRPAGLRHVVVPVANAAEATARRPASGSTPSSASPSCVAPACRSPDEPGAAAGLRAAYHRLVDRPSDAPDLADVVGQARPAAPSRSRPPVATISSSIGPPGAGKTMLAERLPACCRRSTTRRPSRSPRSHSVARRARCRARWCGGRRSCARTTRASRRRSSAADRGAWSARGDLAGPSRGRCSSTRLPSSSGGHRRRCGSRWSPAWSCRRAGRAAGSRPGSSSSWRRTRARAATASARAPGARAHDPASPSTRAGSGAGARPGRPPGGRAAPSPRRAARAGRGVHRRGRSTGPGRPPMPAGHAGRGRLAAQRRRRRDHCSGVAGSACPAPSRRRSTRPSTAVC